MASDELEVRFSMRRDGATVFAVAYEEDGRAVVGWSAEDWATLFRLMRLSAATQEGSAKDSTNG